MIDIPSAFFGALCTLIAELAIVVIACVAKSGQDHEGELLERLEEEKRQRIIRGET